MISAYLALFRESNVLPMLFLLNICNCQLFTIHLLKAFFTSKTLHFPIICLYMVMSIAPLFIVFLTLKLPQPPITCSKSAIETPEQCVKPVESWLKIWEIVGFCWPAFSRIRAESRIWNLRIYNNQVLVFSYGHKKPILFKYLLKE